MSAEKLTPSAIRNELKIISPYDYYCLVAPDQWRVVNAIPLRRWMRRNEENVRNSYMSLRLSTGIIGKLDCPSGDGDGIPKGANEVVIGVGHEGIKALLELGGLPCISCHSGKKLVTLGEDVRNSLKKSIGGDLVLAENPNFLISIYDSRRLAWSKIITLGISPQRFYTRPNLNIEELSVIIKMFTDNRQPLPAIGFYDRNRSDKFNRYII